MTYSVDRRVCRGCGLCVDVCPEQVIRVTEDGYASIDSTKCTGCGACEKICPLGAISKIEALDIRDLRNRLERARERLTRLSARVERLHALSRK